MPTPLKGWSLPESGTAAAPLSRCSITCSLYSWWFYTTSPESAGARVGVCSITAAEFPAGGKYWAVIGSLPGRLIVSLGPFVGLEVSYHPIGGFIIASLPEVPSTSSGIGALLLLTALSVDSSVVCGCGGKHRNS